METSIIPQEIVSVKLQVGYSIVTYTTSNKKYKNHEKKKRKAYLSYAI